MNEQNSFEWSWCELCNGILFSHWCIVYREGALLGGGLFSSQHLQQRAGLWLAEGAYFPNWGPPLCGCQGNGFYSTLVHTQPRGKWADMHYNWCCLRCRKGAVYLFKLKTNGWLHRTSKLHLDWISSSCFQQFLFNGTGQCTIQLWSHPLDMPAHWILSLLYHPFVSCI